MSSPSLHNYLTHSSRLRATCPAVIEPDKGSISYTELEQLSNRVRDRLIATGVKPGQRIGLLLRKSIDTIACIYGILKAGAAYVPVDVTGPISRAAYIFTDCSVTAIFIEAELKKTLQTELFKLDHSNQCKLFELHTPGMGIALTQCLDQLDQQQLARPVGSYDNKDSDLAYILYTSGSTGLPKGVPLSHLNARAFVDWCSSFLNPVTTDRFSAHAPFHFDLSILDLYTPIKHGAALVVLTESSAKDPKKMVEIIEQYQISIWYSTPSVLTMLLNFGNFSNSCVSKLRVILFAGEVFPVNHLRKLMTAQPKAQYYNLYGPTETNVCTYQPVPKEFPKTQATSLAIGSVCHHLKALVVDNTGHPLPVGETGELIICGANVMTGYWNLPENSDRAFFDKPEGKFYRTGDLVIVDTEGVFTYIGRRDRMVKKRGFRVELGEIEAKLRLHPDFYEAAVVATSDNDGLNIQAHLASVSCKKLSIIKIKKFCSEHLPVYMIPDSFHLHNVLPKTSTDKIDYQALEKLHEAKNS